MRLHLTWRAASLAAVSYAIAKLIEGPIHWSDQNIAWAIGNMILVVFVVTIGCAIGVRFAFATRHGALSAEQVLRPSTYVSKVFDWALSVLLGGLAGLAVTLSLARVLSGFEHLSGFSTIIAATALILGFAVITISRSLVFQSIAVAFIAMSAIAFAGSFQPSRILSDADAMADGRAWCLVTSGPAQQISDLDQLDFFTMHKSQVWPNLGLVVRSDGPALLQAHWSIRQQRFVQSPETYATVAACVPRDQFAEALRTGQINSEEFSVGRDLYTIPPEYFPRVSARRISIRSGILVGTDTIHPEITERIAMIVEPREPTLPSDVLPLADLSRLTNSVASTFTHPNGVTISGTDSTTNHILVIKCLHGAYVNETCRVRAFTEDVGYEFMLPFNQLQTVTDALARVKSLFQALRLDE